MRKTWSSHGSRTIPQALNDAVAKWPHKVFLDFSGETHTYAGVDRMASRMAHGLAALGVSAGDRVCSLVDNSSDAVFLWFAVNKLGAVYVPINTDMKGEFLRHQLADADATVMVTEAHYADRVFAIEGGIPALHTLIVRGALPDIGTRLTVRGIDSVRSDDARPIVTPVKPSDLALLIYTSGTTGPSKGCMVSQNYACNCASQVGWATGLLHDDILWTPCPLFHVTGAFGAVLNTLLVGATVSVYPRFSATHFWPEIERSRASIVQLVSIMTGIVADTPDTEVSLRCSGQVRTVYGAPVSAAVSEKWKKRFGVKYAAAPLYGMTEACFVVAAPVETPDVPDGASGRRFDDFDVRVIDDSGDECPPDLPGEIIVRPRRPNIIFQGYWRRPEATVAALRDLWFHTGDIGKFDKNDFFYFVDRKKDYLRRGGENISSFEVEAAFLAHPDIAEVAVHAVLSEISEDELKVTAVLKPGADITEEELCRWSQERVPHFVVPRFIEFRQHLPRTPTGRVQKFLLRDQGVTETTWDRKKSAIGAPSR